ncbi:MAG: EutN/CcmL family microcompartment protein [Eubacteriales bacterium]|nr:EutN/CcmL family microcompartment protein [Eubacteriales bacterium]
MIAARVIECVWAVRTARTLTGSRLILAETIGGSRNGERLVAVDTVGAGIGEKVLIAAGTAARNMLGDDKSPVDAAVVAVLEAECALDRVWAVKGGKSWNEAGYLCQ